MFQIRSLRFRLSLMHGLVIAIVIVCVGFVRYQMVSYRARRSFDQVLLSDAQLFLSRLTVGSRQLVWSTQGLGPGEVLSMEQLRYYFILTDLQGKAVREDLHSIHMREMLEERALEQILRAHSGFAQATAGDGTVFRFVSLPVVSDEGEQSFIMHLGRSTRPLEGTLDEYLFIYASSVPLMFVISVGVGWFLAGRALRPFEEVSETAGRINSKNLNVTIEVPSREEEVQRLVRALNAMVHRLQASFQQIRRFTADAAHELRTPLAILQGENEIALRSPSMPEEVRTVLSSNLEELARLTHLVNDLLVLSEAEGGTRIMSKKPTPVGKLFAEIVDDVRVLALERRIAIEARDMPEATIDADQLWMQRALLNILDNAIKYSDDGSRVEVAAYVSGDKVRLEVRDHGIGIDPHDLPHIFDRFYRTDPARARTSGGVGLGLALVKWIVEAHDGQIQVTSRPGKGTHVEIILPLLPAA